MIEEILGLREYQLKKLESERKLKNTFFNLEKVKAMIQEVLPHLRLLKRQTNKWAKRRDLEEELQNFEKTYFSFKLGEIAAAEAEIKPKLFSLEKQIVGKRKELDALEMEIKKIESQPQEYEEIKRIKAERNKLLSERSQIEKELGRLEAKIEILNSVPAETKIYKNEELLDLIKEIKLSLEKSLGLPDLPRIKELLEELTKKITLFLSPARERNQKSDEFRELERIRDSLLKKFSHLEKGLKELESEEASITTSLEEFNKQFQKNFDLLEVKREELGKLKEQRNKFIFEKERLNLRFEEVKSRLLEIGKSIGDFEADKSVEISEDELRNMEKGMFRLLAELASMGEVDEALIKEAGEVENHYNFLKNQSEDLEKAAVDLKNLIKELSEKIHHEFNSSLKEINEEFNKFFRLMFGGGFAKLKIKRQEARSRGQEGEERNEEIEEAEKKAEKIEEEEEKEAAVGIEIELGLPKKRISGLDILSGGEKSLVSIAALFSLISVSPPPFFVLDEVDAALDEANSKRFSNLIKEFSQKTQFLVVTHNRATMEAADVLYGVTMGNDGASKLLSLKLEGST